MSFPIWTDDPVRDAEAYANYLDEIEVEKHTCDICGEEIEDRCDCYYEIDGDLWCEECMDKRRVWVV